MKSSLIAAAAAAFVSTGEPAAAAQTCMAAVYADGFGRPLADGKRHSVDELLVAHRTLPLGTVVDITLLATGKTVRAIVRDRGPFVRNRCVDLSAETARALGVADVGRVKIEPVVASSTAQASPNSGADDHAFHLSFAYVSDFQISSSPAMRHQAAAKPLGQSCASAALMGEFREGASRSIEFMYD